MHTPGKIKLADSPEWLAPHFVHSYCNGHYELTCPSGQAFWYRLQELVLTRRTSPAIFRCNGQVSTEGRFGDGKRTQIGASGHGCSLAGSLFGGVNALLWSDVQRARPDALVAGPDAIRSDCGGDPDPEYRMGKRRTRHRQFAVGASAHSFGHASNLDSATCLPCAAVGLLPGKSEKTKGLCAIPSGRVRRLSKTDVPYTHFGTARETFGCAWHWPGNRGFHLALCREPSGFCGRCLYPQDIWPPRNY